MGYNGGGAHLYKQEKIWSGQKKFNKKTESHTSKSIEFYQKI